MIYPILTVGGVLVLALIVATWISVLRNREVSAGEKAVWVVAVVVFPLFGSLVYFTVRRGW